MPASLSIPLSTLTGFLLVLCRVSGVFILVPVPGLRGGPDVARVVLSVFMTLALMARWPVANIAQPSLAVLLMWIVSETALGLGLGLIVATVMEAFQLGAQLLSLQFGFSYASTIDPTTQAESNVLVVTSQLLAGLMFFTSGLDREVLRALAASLESFPPGAVHPSGSMGQSVVELLATLFSTGFRLVLPAIALLAMVDVALALLGRLHAHLQLLTLAFPLKILVGLAFLAALLVLFPNTFRQSAAQTLGALRTAAQTGP